MAVAVLAPHVHAFTTRGTRFACACGVIGYRAIGAGYQRGTAVKPFTCQQELAGRKHCGKDATHVTGARTQSRCTEHAAADRRSA